MVSSDVGGIREYVSEWNGRLVPPGDEEALLNMLNYMLDHYYKFNAKIIREFAIANFSNETVTEKLKELYRFTGKFKD